jgi:hypothetical protein
VVAIEDDLAAVAAALTQAQEQLGELRSIRATIVEAAIDEGMSHRHIAGCLGISHTAVQQILLEQEIFHRKFMEEYFPDS